MINPTIAIIDSGVGGVSILNRLIKYFHAGNYIYFADNAYLPYGNRTKSEIKSRIEYIINLLKNEYKVDIIILACNTASSCINKQLDNLITLEFDKKNTYLATPLTKSNLKEINIIADKSLANQIEDNILFPKKIDTIIKRRVINHKLNRLKNLVLGCTHYELVFDSFKKHCPITKVTLNSDIILNKVKNIKYTTNSINIKIFLSKESNNYRNKINSLINNLFSR